MSDQSNTNYDRSEINARAAGMSIFITVVIVSIVFGISIYFFHTTLSAELTRKANTPVSRQRLALQTYEKHRLSEYRWIDKQAGTVQLPIDVAIDRVVDAYNR